MFTAFAHFPFTHKGRLRTSFLSAAQLCRLQFRLSPTHSNWISDLTMLIESSRYASLFSLILLAQLVSCGFWDKVPWNPTENSVYGDSSQPTTQPPNPAFAPNQSVIQPSPTYNADCHLCTISLSVSHGSLPRISRNPDKRCSQSLYIIGLKSPQTRPVSPQFLAHHRLPSPPD